MNKYKHMYIYVYIYTHIYIYIYIHIYIYIYIYIYKQTNLALLVHELPQLLVDACVQNVYNII